MSDIQLQASGVGEANTRMIPMVLPVVVIVTYSLFMLVLVPTYIVRYGPTNFLYFCDLALLLTLLALWTRWSLPASMAAVAILIPQILWMIDLVCTLSGHHLLGMTDYMFESANPLFVRVLSLFHVWLPFFLIWVLRRMGYDRRAWWIWTLAGSIVMLINYGLMPAPPSPADKPGMPVNINLVFGFSDKAPQSWLPPRYYLMLLLAAMPVLCYIPAHLFLRWLCPLPLKADGADQKLPRTPSPTIHAG